MIECKDIIELLKKEVVPALGCTEPIAVALAASKAYRSIGGDIQSIKVKVSPNIYKNGMSVGIPGINRCGLEIAAALGAIGGNSDKLLEVLSEIEENHSVLAQELVDSNKVKIEIVDVPENLYIECIVATDIGNSKAIIKNKHNNICHTEVNGKVIDSLSSNVESSECKLPVVDITILSIKEIIELVESIPDPCLDFMLHGAKLNTEIAEAGIKEALGMAIGTRIFKSITKGNTIDDAINYAVALTSGGADARMSGKKMPVMSSAGSGNHGLTAILPVVAVASTINASTEKLAKALAISHLVTIYIKNYTGKLSALCGCAVAAATGSSAAITWMAGGNPVQVSGAIKNMIADVAGVICDGAKVGCSLKLSTATYASLRSAILALDNIIVPKTDGIIDDSAEETIKNLGKISTPGMVETDRTILDIMLIKNKGWVKGTYEVC